MTKQHVLIIDDTRWWAESVGRTLAAEGFGVEYSAHGLQAIDMIDEHRPDVIILDIFLPGPNGIALLHELRSHQDLASIPVIVVSGAVSEEVASTLAAYGISAVLDKGHVTPAQLTAAVRRSLL